METIIKPKKGLASFDFKELWNYRELFYFLSWRDIKVRYKQTVLGIAWAVLQPFLTMVVFSIIFGSMAKMPSDNIPYPIFVYTGLLLWDIFANSLSNASSSLVGNAAIIQKVYVPKLIITASSAISCLVDFFFAFMVLWGIMFYYHFMPSFKGLLFLPLALFVTLLASLGLGWFLAAANVRYRDIRYVLPFFIQLLIFVTPVIYPVSIVPQNYRWLLYLNPMTGVIETFKASFLGTGIINWNAFLISIIIGFIFFIFGLWYFLKTEKIFADVI
jgi:lipopolysaccharide transport system permease protein